MARLICIRPSIELTRGKTYESKQRQNNVDVISDSGDLRTYLSSRFIEAPDVKTCDRCGITDPASDEDIENPCATHRWLEP